jgi:starvation-inducible DNA-binding protein
MYNENLALPEKLAHLLSDSVTAAFIVQGYHWNIKGIEFTQFHDFFGDIYADIFSAVDPLAENIRKLGFDAPYFLQDFQDMTCISENRIENGDALKMVRSIDKINDSLLVCYMGAFSQATAVNEQGIADFLAGRINAHQMWSWQLKATLGIR